MKRTITALAILLTAFAADAGTLSNSDSKAYNLEISQSGGRTDTRISGKTTTAHTCSYFPCTITNKDTGDKIKLTSSDQNVVIKDGKFSSR